MDIKQVWAELIEQIKSYPDINAMQLDAVFSRIQLQAISNGFILLTAPTPFLKQLMETLYLGDIRKALKDLYGIEFHIQIEVDTTQQDIVELPKPLHSDPSHAQKNEEQGESVNKSTAPARNINEQSVTKTDGAAEPENEYLRYQRELFEEREPVISPEREVNGAAHGIGFQTHKPHQSKNPLFSGAVAPSLTFDSFVIGDSNRLAYQMAVEVAERPGDTSLNPLFIYGRSGVGKTHLLCAIHNYIREQYPWMNVCYIDSMDLVNRYSDAAITKSVDKYSFKNFEASFNEADVLLIDDIQRLQGKSGTLDIVFRIFNSMIARGKQMVFAADRAPKNIDLDERYTSRFNQGATIDIQPPNDETKRSIIKSFIRHYREEEGIDLDLSEDTIDYVVENSSANVREIKSAINGVIFAIKTNGGKPLPKYKIRELLDNHFTSSTSNKVTVQAIQQAVEEFYGVSHADLIGQNRTKQVSHARQVSIYIIREMLDETYPSIAEIFKRNNATVMYAYNKISEYMKEDRNLREEVEAIKEKLRVQQY